MSYENPSSTQTTRPKNAPSPALAQLIAEDISLRDLIDSAFSGLSSLQEEIREAGTARTRLHALISQCDKDDDPSVKTVQEIGYYNTELREWTARLGALEAELETLRDDVGFLAASSAMPCSALTARKFNKWKSNLPQINYLQNRLPTSANPYYSPSQVNYLRSGSSTQPRPATSTYQPYYGTYPAVQQPTYAMPEHAPQQPVPNMEGWVKGTDRYGRCTRRRQEGRYRITLPAPNDNPERGMHLGYWTPEMGYESMRREAEAAARMARELWR